MKTLQRTSRLTVAALILLLASVVFAAEPALSSGNTFQLTDRERLWLREHPVVKVRVSPTYPPFEFYRDGRYQGLAVDYLDLVAKRLGIRFEPVDARMSWSEALKRLREKEDIDLILMITRTAERARDIEFSRDYISFPLVIFSRKDGDFISGIQDLRRGKTIIENSFIAREWLKRDVPEVELADADTSIEALKAVATGAAKAYVGNLAVGSYFIQTEGLVNLKVAAPTPYGQDDMAMGVRKDWPELASLLTRALDSITAEETGAIRNRWLSVRYEHGLRIRDVVFWISLVAAIALLFIIQLRRLVKSRTAHLEKEIAERIQAEQALLESRARYKTLVDSVPLGINLIDANHRIVMSNATMGRWFAKEPTLLIGHPCYREFEKRDQVCNHCPGTVSMTTGVLAMTETEGVKDDGSRFAARIRTVPIGTPENPTGFIEVVEDITAARKAEEEKARVESQLAQAQKMESIGTLAGGIAHDFNNILSAVLGFTELALMRSEQGTPIRHDLEEVRRAAYRATDLVKQILTFSHKQQQEKSPLQLSLVIKEALKLLRASIPTTIEIRQDITAQGTVLADPTQIHQVVMNLCTNAYHAMLERGGVLEVTLKEETIDRAMLDSGIELPPGQYLKLAVSDTGCGMDHETRARIFEPYFTTKEKGRGTGLGLAVVHGIVKDHHGRITVDSEPGRGATFTVYLPMIAQEQAAASQVAGLPPLARAHERIMVVDDEATLRDMTRQTLSQAGYQVDLFANGAEAWAAFHETPDAWRLLLTDQTMPEMTGDQLAAKALELRPALPVIICSGYSATLDDTRAHSLGVKAYLQKPVGVFALLTAVAEALRGEDT